MRDKIPAGERFKIYGLVGDGNRFRLIVQHRIKTADASIVERTERLDETWSEKGYREGMTRVGLLNVGERNRLLFPVSE